MSTPLREHITRELPSLIELRHDLHRHPELAFQETRTSGVVQRELKALGIAFKAGYGEGTGVVAYLPPSAPSTTTVALRADMDALPIVEVTGRPHRSETEGVMHACGHDGHTTILLGAARVLARCHRPNGVTLVFQPAEEHGGGAKVMGDQGALSGDGVAGGIGARVTRIYGLHGWPQLPLGTVATKVGPLLAATDEFRVTVRGVQSHGAYPHLGYDPIVAAAHVITALQTIASRNVSPLDSVVVTVGVIRGGTANNIIPAEVSLVGTVRTLRPETRDLAKRRLYAVIEGTARAHGCTADIDWQEGYPMTVNHPAATERFFAIADAAIPGCVQRLEEATMGGEDFSYYSRHCEACFFFLGLRPLAGAYPSLHQPDFDFNDDALGLGIKLMCELALNG